MSTSTGLKRPRKPDESGDGSSDDHLALEYKTPEPYDPIARLEDSTPPPIGLEDIEFPNRREGDVDFDIDDYEIFSRNMDAEADHDQISSDD